MEGGRRLLEFGSTKREALRRRSACDSVVHRSTLSIKAESTYCTPTSPRYMWAKPTRVYSGD
jgi:hypothetical protein